MKHAILAKTRTGRLLGAALLALGLSAPAWAQAQIPAQAAPAAAPAQDYGLLGQNYAGFDMGYVRFEQHPRPELYHDYGFTDNQAIVRGLDFNFNYDYLTGTYNGVHDFRDTATAGLTGYLPVTSWARPFAMAEAGLAWQRMSTVYPGGMRDTRFTDLLGAGVEFQVLPRLVLSPYAAYDEIHRWQEDWNYGVKATWRVSERWSLTLNPQCDQHHDLGYFAGINFHY